MSEINSRYLDPLSNFGFNHLFKVQAHKEILIDFLNAHFKRDKHIIDVAKNPIKGLGDGKPYQRTLSDLICTTVTGKHIAVEIHYLKAHNFLKKNRNFIERHYRHQASKAQLDSPYPCDEFYMLGFLGFQLTAQIQCLQFQDYCSITMKSKETSTKTLGFKLMEFRNFDHGQTELVSSLDKWAYLLQHMPKATAIPEALNHGIFPTVFAFAEIAGLTVEERLEYEAEIAYR